MPVVRLGIGNKGCWDPLASLAKLLSVEVILVGSRGLGRWEAESYVLREGEDWGESRGPLRKS